MTACFFVFFSYIISKNKPTVKRELQEAVPYSAILRKKGKNTAKYAAFLHENFVWCLFLQAGKEIFGNIQQKAIHFVCVWERRGLL
jgi:hypothetical protein